MKNYKLRAEKIETRIQELAQYSDEQDCLSRIFGTKAFLECQNKIEAWMKEAGLQTYIDNIGNVRGKLLSKESDAKTFVIASHFDTVINAGKYDGVLGILAGLDIMENLATKNIQLPFNIELIAFSDEEGVRFHTSYLGSKIVAGNFNSGLLETKDDNGISLGQALQGLLYDDAKLTENAIKSEEWLGYYEIHIEQGPILYNNNIPAGIVTAIAGKRRISIGFTGVSGHAGTVPMKMRADALCAAAEFILAVEQFASSKKSDVIATVGKLEIPHAASNFIPGKVTCSLDLRSGSKKKLTRAYQDINEICEEICDQRKVYFEWNLVQETNAVTCDETLTRLLKKSIKQKEMEVIELESGAGHDAVAISTIAPVAMLFVKCFEGISHNPLEKVEIKDIAATLEISDNFIQQLIKSSASSG
ncbi:MAG TPA: allantoate amidohydrolase [Chitinophagaceae bacterium]|nr:allantoate amidohydrolase [Chitinophagaceae bacterium]